MKTAVIGCGRWGTFIAWYLQYMKHEVSLYGRSTSKNMLELMEQGKNDYLTLPEEITLITDLSKAMEAEAVFISVNSQGLRKLCAELKSFDYKDKHFVLCMKGIEIATGDRLTTVVKEELGEDTHVSVWLGPGHVQEYVQGRPNCMVIDSAEKSEREFLVEALSGGLIRFYLGTDLVGNEIGGATKNVIGIAAGMLDGLGLGSLKGALMARGTYEVSRLIESQGGNPISAYGLCHLGDYEATVFSEFSHNRRYGENYVKGIENTSFAEGVETAKAVHDISVNHELDLPICTAVYAILYEQADPKEKLMELFERSVKKEFMEVYK